MPGGLQGLGEQLAGTAESGVLMEELRRALTPILSEAQSGADRLRPPFATPLGGLEPATAGAARDVEVGYGQLPAVYQQALQAAPVRQTQVGTFPRGYTLWGETAPADAATGMPAYLVGRDARTMLHELVHELQQRTDDPNAFEVQEAIARRVAGDDPLALGGPAEDPLARAQAAAYDAQFRARGGRPEQPLSGLEYLLWMLKAYDPLHPRPTK
jgi:hypothetical protein